MGVSSCIVIRLATPSDAPVVAGIYAPIVRDTHLSAEFDVPTVEEMQRRIADTLLTHPWLVAERDGEILGYAYATSHRSRSGYQWTCEVSAYIRPTDHRRGVGRALYTSLFAVLRLQGFQQAIAVIALPNPPSVALHESMGFVPVGVFPSVCHKQGQWYDIGWWRLSLDFQADEPPTLRTPSELTGTVEWGSALASGTARDE
jgi:phosphinothricin acetyltransferase